MPPTQKKWPYSGGFTLIELSIVLVIIGLVIGGVLMGQSLIEAANIRKQMSDLEALDTSVQTFRLKYGGLPGDITIEEATALNLSFATGAQTPPYNYHNNDGKIGHYVSPACGHSVSFQPGSDLSCNQSVFGEPAYFFLQLNEANLNGFKPTGTNANAVNRVVPKLIFGNGYYTPISSPLGYNGWFLGVGTSSITNHLMSVNALNGAFTPAQGYQLDVKFDDGLPDGGKVRAAMSGTGAGPFVDWGPTGAYTRNCVTGAAGSRAYDTTMTGLECQMWVRASW